MSINVLITKLTRRRGFKTKILLIFPFVVLAVFVHFNHRSYSRYTYARGEPCRRNQTTLLETFRRTHDVLKELNLTHFLVYGSLWGSLRYGRPLPWDHDFDLGLFHSEVTAVPQQVLYNAFRNHGLGLRYLWNTGAYQVYYKDRRGDLMLFKEYYSSGWMERTGLESYVFSIQYAGYHTFPAILISHPESLPTVEFAGCTVAVPRGGMMIQKYHYPDDWWKETKPVGCP